MTVITRSRTENYAVVPNTVTEDSRLSFEARGVLCYLLAKPNNWQVQISDLQKQGNFGRDKAYRILKELREVGYLVLEVKRNDKAQIISQDYIVYDVADVSKKLFPEKPDTAEPDLVEPDTANTDGIISKDNITNTHSFSDAKASSKQNARDEKRGFEQEFHETFWPTYPHKVGKPRALKSFLRARKTDGLENIMAGLERYVSGKPPDRQWLNPETFLNQERWNDQPAATSEQNHARTNTDNRSTARKFTEAILNDCRRKGVDPFKPIIGGNVSSEVPVWGETDSGTDCQNPLDDDGGARLALVASNAR